MVCYRGSTPRSRLSGLRKSCAPPFSSGLAAAPLSRRVLSRSESADFSSNALARIRLATLSGTISLADHYRERAAPDPRPLLPCLAVRRAAPHLGRESARVPVRRDAESDTDRPDADIKNWGTARAGIPSPSSSPLPSCSIAFRSDAEKDFSYPLGCVLHAIRCMLVHICAIPIRDRHQSMCPVEPRPFALRQFHRARRNAGKQTVAGRIPARFHVPRVERDPPAAARRHRHVVNHSRQMTALAAPDLEQRPWLAARVRPSVAHGLRWRVRYRLRNSCPHRDKLVFRTIRRLGLRRSSFASPRAWLSTPPRPASSSSRLASLRPAGGLRRNLHANRAAWAVTSHHPPIETSENENLGAVRAGQNLNAGPRQNREADTAQSEMLEFREPRSEHQLAEQRLPQRVSQRIRISRSTIAVMRFLDHKDRKRANTQKAARSSDPQIHPIRIISWPCANPPGARLASPTVALMIAARSEPGEPEQILAC